MSETTRYQLQGTWDGVWWELASYGTEFDALAALRAASRKRSKARLEHPDATEFRVVANTITSTVRVIR